MNNQKIGAYIGFAVKKGSAIFGLDSIEASRKRVFLVLYSSDLASNSLKKLKTFSTNSNTSCKNFDGLSELLKRNCKVIGITDRQLAQSILQNFAMKLEGSEWQT